MFTISKGFAVISATKNLQLPFIEDIFASGRTRFLEWVVSENQKKMMEDYEKAKQELAESSGIELDHITVSKQQQLEIMAAELGVARGRRIRGLGSNLRVESSRDRTTATSSLATEQKVEELQGTVGELKGTVSELQGTVGKLLGVIEWMRTHVGALPPDMDMGVPPQHVGDPTYGDDDDDDDNISLGH
ncbi:uncharacterized protein LOC110750597 [Prunus avium]|uniref:Uncharacterized protein LOC110750597 n=1 Tax=Prunus avium TaxID=42229 RepID=A0A6P5RY31_PRUAV|nr:uncharacterized protein LOC110750597 [Prunus avium]